MRFIHTADWHLGRLFHGMHLTGDQAHVLGQLVDLVKDAKAQAVIIAGDVFDRAVPPPEAVELFDEVLARLALDLKVPVIAIAGNHDSPQRLGFGARLFSSSGVHVCGRVSRQMLAVELADEHGPVRFYALPYAEPPVVRECFGDGEVVDHDSAMRRCVREIGQSHPAGCRGVLVAHGFVTGGRECESERPLCVGGSSSVSENHFGGFNYVALGHLHEPQEVEGGRAHYSGSLLKYSISEAEHEKSISIVDMDGAGKCIVERVALSPRHDVRCLRGLLADILKGPAPGENREDYVHVTLEAAGALLDPIGRLREFYPNVIGIDRPEFVARAQGDDRRIDHRKVGDADLFAAFMDQVTGTKLTPEQAEAFAQVAGTLRAEEREVLA